MPGCHTFSGDEALAYVRSRYFEYQTADGKWHLDNAYDLGRISRQQDFLRRLFETAQEKGVFNASVAKGMIDTLTKYVVVDQSLSIDDMLQFLGVLQQVQADGVPDLPGGGQAVRSCRTTTCSKRRSTRRRCSRSSTCSAARRR